MRAEARSTRAAESFGMRRSALGFGFGLGALGLGLCVCVLVSGNQERSQRLDGIQRRCEMLQAEIDRLRLAVDSHLAPELHGKPEVHE